MKTKPSSTQAGYSVIQLLITIAVMTIIAGFAVVSVSRARNHVRMMNSARQFGAYVERARADAVRRHGDTTINLVDNNTYSVRMDWDGFGNPRIQNFDLESGIVFTTLPGTSITFNWRGRINREQSFGFYNGSNSVNINVTGSGDVTFDSEWFFDNSLPPVTLNNGNPGGTAPDPGATPQASPSPGSSPNASPSPSPSPSPYTSPSPGASPNPSPGVSPNPSPGVSPSPGGSPNPSPNPSPVVCSITAEPSSMSILQNGSADVFVRLNNFTGAGTISAASSNGGQIQVAPTSNAVSGSAAVKFTVTIKKIDGSVTFSATGCGSTVVPITVR